MIDRPDLVPEAKAGKLIGTFASVKEDGFDSDDRPDTRPLNGTLTITPSVRQLQFPTAATPRTVLLQTIEVPVVQGEIYKRAVSREMIGVLPDGTIKPGLHLYATNQPAALPPIFQYTALIRFDDGSQYGPIVFEVDPGQVTDLAKVVSATPAPGTVVVYSAEDRIRAEAAAATATSAATVAAQQAVAQLTPTVTAATTAANAAATNAHGAATVALDAAQVALRAADLAMASIYEAGSKPEFYAWLAQHPLVARENLLVRIMGELFIVKDSVLIPFFPDRADDLHYAGLLWFDVSVHPAGPDPRFDALIWFDINYSA